MADWDKYTLWLSQPKSGDKQDLYSSDFNTKALLSMHPRKTCEIHFIQVWYKRKIQVQRELSNQVALVAVFCHQFLNLKNIVAGLDGLPEDISSLLS